MARMADALGRTAAQSRLARARPAPLAARRQDASPRARPGPAPLCVARYPRRARRAPRPRHPRHHAVRLRARGRRSAHAGAGLRTAGRGRVAPATRKGRKRAPHPGAPHRARLPGRVPRRRRLARARVRASASVPIRPGPRQSAFPASRSIAQPCSASSSGAAEPWVCRARSATIRSERRASPCIKRTAATSRTRLVWPGTPTRARRSSTTGAGQPSAASTSSGFACERLPTPNHTALASIS